MCSGVSKENLSIYCVFPLGFECVCVYVEVLHCILNLLRVNSVDHGVNIVFKKFESVWGGEGKWSGYILDVSSEF